MTPSTASGRLFLETLPFTVDTDSFGFEFMDVSRAREVSANGDETMIPWLLTLWAKASPLKGFLGKHWLKIAAVAVLGLAWVHYTGLREENEKLRHNLDKTTVALTRLETQAHDLEAALERNASDAREARKERDRVFDLLERADLDALAREDPASLERSVNERADGVLHDLRCATGGACTDPGEAGASEP